MKLWFLVAIGSPCSVTDNICSVGHDYPATAKHLCCIVYPMCAVTLTCILIKGFGLPEGLKSAIFLCLTLWLI